MKTFEVRVKIHNGRYIDFGRYQGVDMLAAVAEASKTADARDFQARREGTKRYRLVKIRAGCIGY